MPEVHADAAGATHARGTALAPKVHTSTLISASSAV